VRLVTSDAHAGLVAAIDATLPGASWQRCRTYYTVNLMTVCLKSSSPWVRTLLHAVFDQADAESVAAQYDRRLDPLSGKLPKVADHLDAARADLLAFTVFPKQMRRQIWSNNRQERLNKEVRRRTDVVGIFPDRSAITRLVDAVLAEQHDEWIEGRRYLGLDALTRSRATTTEPHPAERGPRPTSPHSLTETGSPITAHLHHTQGLHPRRTAIARQSRLDRKGSKPVQWATGMSLVQGQGVSENTSRWSRDDVLPVDARSAIRSSYMGESAT
jgi:hypothetical protein